MAESSTNNRRPRGNGNRNGNRNRNRNRGRNGNRNSGGRNNKSGGERKHQPQGFRNNSSIERFPRPKRRKSLWEKILAFFGINKEKKNAKAQASRNDAKPKRQQRKGAQKSSGNRRDGSAQKTRREPKKRTPRTPEIVAVTTPRLYVGNLSFDASESDIFELFKGVGEVRNAEIVTNQKSQRSKGYAFVVMGDVATAKRAVDTLHDKEFMGRKLVVSGAKSEGIKG